MLLKTKKASDINGSEITPQSIYQDRRRFVQTSGRFALMGLGAMLVGCSQEGEAVDKSSPETAKKSKGWLVNQVRSVQTSLHITTKGLTPHKYVTTYNNFYEFGTGKADPAKNAHTLKTAPWSVVVEGEVAKPGRYHLEDILNSSYALS